jgi:hypothetical protein
MEVFQGMLERQIPAVVVGAQGQITAVLVGPA